jgi:hypothetical protein
MGWGSGRLVAVVVLICAMMLLQGFERWSSRLGGVLTFQFYETFNFSFQHHKHIKMAPKSEPSEAEIVFARAQVAHAKMQRLVASWLPSKTAEELANAKTDEELAKEDEELFKPIPEL